ncbi:MAG: hypothetical protein DMG39_11900 [Acidobacteria bacterium]|nr:MAG: hypothetical protein DMG39_11900 [Acidobacteriota bacterium]
MLLVVLLLAALAVAAWLLRRSASAEHAGSAKARADKANAPEIWLSVNGSGDVEVAPGWPLIVQLVVLHPRAMQTNDKVPPINVAPRSGSWADAVGFTVRSEKSGPQSWALNLVAPAEPSLRLDALAAGEAYWWMSPEETQKLGEGDYELVATLEVDASANEAGWKGSARSMPVTVHVRKASEPASAELVSQKYALLASYASLWNDQKQALAYVDEAMLRIPKDVRIWEIDGDLLAAANRNAEALFAYSRALKLFYEQNPKSAEPPGLLLIKEREMVKRVLAEK